MKTLVVYYSLDGNTRFAAETIAEATGGDLLELEPVKDLTQSGLLKFAWGGFQVMMKSTPELEPLDKDPADYDLLFIGTPVWNRNLTPAARTFMTETDLSGKQVALFCTYAGNAGKTFATMRELIQVAEVMGELGQKEPLADQAVAGPRAAEWAKAILEQAA